ncbi:MAG: aminotransferase class V-fold PLP-dependent enzyme [Acidobacteria bacterium]|nr:aminotransferase class V-fold PLP-dependent enzyme [Acidobacteriota bacterium]
MPFKLQELAAHPNALAPHYSRFRVGERLLLDGHSHQAWPDCAREGQLEAWDDAATLGGEKWERAFAKADRVRQSFASLLDDPEGLYALGSNTHELVLRFLSALPLPQRRQLITTTGEFHSIRRQLQRLEEAGVEVLWVDAEPTSSLSERLAEAVSDRTAAVLASVVLFKTGSIVHELERVLKACSRQGAELLVDTYHALNVVPFSMRDESLEGAFAVGGGYKYCQLGEGNCFLRIPPGRTFRPVITGWYSEFTALSSASADGSVAYGRGADAFAGATYDPTSHYRASRVFDFFQEQGLRPELLRDVSQHQVRLLISAFDDLELDPDVLRRDRSVEPSEIGGFLALRSRQADEIRRRLAGAGVATDSRGDWLRFGPAPYLSDRQILDSIEILAAVIRDLEAGRGRT